MDKRVYWRAKSFSETVTNKDNNEKMINQNTNDNNQAFKTVLYNSVAVAFVIICFALSGLLIILLQVFVRSILWALLTGAFLFSLKRYLRRMHHYHFKWLPYRFKLLIIH